MNHPNSNADGALVDPAATDAVTDTALLQVQNLEVRFQVGSRFGVKKYLQAVDQVSFSIQRGETLGLVGESGSGKTTTALAVARLVSAAAGSVTLDGDDLLNCSGDQLRALRHKMQFIFQDPYSSLNPRLRAEQVVLEPLTNLGKLSASTQLETIDRLFAAVGLRPEQKRLFPHQFSGGQRQRIGIARALATNPELIICDEPVSALDVAVQSQILNLLRRLQSERNLTYLFISHDLGVVQHMCDRVAVMYMGRIVEFADRKSLFNTPQHPYTHALLSAVPSINKRRGAANTRIKIPGDPPDPVNLPSGCRFVSRCPIAIDRCRQEEPVLAGSAQQQVACHRVAEPVPIRQLLADG